MIDIMTEASNEEMPTEVMISCLHDLGYDRVDALSLASSLRKFQVAPRRITLAGIRSRGYVLADLKRVAKSVPFAVQVPSGAVPGTGRNIGLDESAGGSLDAAARLSQDCTEDDL
jgi:hypothetical protein